MEQKQALIYGFGEEEEQVCGILRSLDIAPIAVSREDTGRQVGALCGLGGYRKTGTAFDGDGALMVFHNLTREELDDVLKALRGISRPSIKAMVTPTNLSWPLSTLLEEVQQEQIIMGELMKLGRLRRTVTPDPFNFRLMQALVQAEKCFSGGEEVTLELVKKAYADLEAAIG